jgi:hypothetical protein
MENSPIILDLVTFNNVFFDDECVEELIDTGTLEFTTVTTKSGMDSKLTISLEKKYDEEFFELRCSITSYFGVEDIYYYDSLENLNEFKLKHWIYILTCDEGRKKTYINDFKGCYNFKSGINLSE